MIAEYASYGGRQIAPVKCIKIDSYRVLDNTNMVGVIIKVLTFTVDT